MRRCSSPPPPWTPPWPASGRCTSPSSTSGPGASWPTRPWRAGRGHRARAPRPVVRRRRGRRSHRRARLGLPRRRVPGAVDAGIGATDSLFVNVEPVSLRVPCPDHLRAGYARDAAPGCGWSSRSPSGSSRWTRPRCWRRWRPPGADGWGIALDDVGADPASLALMPFLQPGRDQARHGAGAAPRPHHRRRGQRRAGPGRAHGRADPGRGHRDGGHLAPRGRWAPRSGRGGCSAGRAASCPGSTGLPFTSARDAAASATPFDLVAGERRVERTTKALLLPTSRFIEQRAHAEPEPPVVLSAFQQARFFTPDSARRYQALAACSAFVGVVAAGMDGAPIPACGARRWPPATRSRGVGRRGHDPALRRRASSPGTWATTAPIGSRASTTS